MISIDSQKTTKERKKCRLRKVYYAFYDYEVGPPHPVIRLGGKYLEHWGFHIGDSIEVDLEIGRITIVRTAHTAAVTDKPKA